MTTPSFGVSTRKTRRDFQRLAELRAKEARILVQKGSKQGAYYLGGMAVECALKACIAKRTRRHEFPPDRSFVSDVYSHDLKKLLKLAGLDDRLDKDCEVNPSPAANWGVVESWKNDSRYEPSGLQGKDMEIAINSKDGVLGWIRLHW